MSSNRFLVQSLRGTSLPTIPGYDAHVEGANVSVSKKLDRLMHGLRRRIGPSVETNKGGVGKAPMMMMKMMYSAFGWQSWLLGPGPWILV